MKHFLIGLTLLLAFVPGVQAGGPPPLYLVVDKVVLEPSAATPTRVQIWATFIELSKDHLSYGAPRRGYLYYAKDEGPGKDREFQEAIAVLREAAKAKQVLSFGCCGSPAVDGHIRKLTDQPQSPLRFPDGQFERVDKKDYNDLRLKPLLLSAGLAQR